MTLAYPVDSAKHKMLGSTRPRDATARGRLKQPDKQKMTSRNRTEIGRFWDLLVSESDTVD
jgi:hypothetical protein